MHNTTKTTERPRMSCDTCPFKARAQRTPLSGLGKLWLWHTSFCPGWKRYVKARYEHGEPPPAMGSKRGFWNK